MKYIIIPLLLLVLSVPASFLVMLWGIIASLIAIWEADSRPIIDFKNECKSELKSLFEYLKNL